MYLKEFVRTYKDEKLTPETFCDPDGVLLATFVLADLPSIIPPNKPIHFKDAMKKQIAYHQEKKFGLLLPLAMTKLMNEASSTKRYKNVIFHDLYCVIDECECVQATFLQADISENVTVVIFTGTDDTIVGWREDFKMVYGKSVPCLKHAMNYVNNSLSYDKKYIFVGHSKGGYESLYAGLMCEKYKDNIIAICDYDGPGYPEDINNQLKKSPLLDKARIVVPHGCTVGRLFNYPLEKNIVYSNEFGIMQHNPFSWRIKDKEFDFRDTYKKNTDFLPNKIVGVYQHFSVDVLKHFEYVLFDVLMAGGSKTLSDIPGHLSYVREKFMNLTKEDKLLYLRFMNYLVKGRVIPRRFLFQRQPQLKKEEK